MDIDVICEQTRDHETVARTWNLDVGPHNSYVTTTQINYQNFKIWYRTEQPDMLECIY